MGLKSAMQRSACSCDEPQKVIVVNQQQPPAPKEEKLPNPNPRNFKFKKIEIMEEYALAWINYPDCTNYEGDKILVFENMSLTDMANMNRIDPHFCDGEHPSPIARFEPTERGWDMAIAFITGWRGY